MVNVTPTENNNPFTYRLPQVVKAVAALALTAITALYTMVVDDGITLEETAGFVGALITAWTVFKARNAPS